MQTEYRRRLAEMDTAEIESDVRILQNELQIARRGTSEVSVRLIRDDLRNARTELRRRADR